MGQRLVITVHAFDEDIAKIYYHWSAYTTSALDEAQKILKNVKWEDTTSKNELILRIVRFMESNGGCIDFEDKPEFNKRFPNVEFKDDGSRNDGLVAISKQVMDKQKYWSEGDLIIDFDNEMICNSVFWWYDSTNLCGMNLARIAILILTLFRSSRSILANSRSMILHI